MEPEQVLGVHVELEMGQHRERQTTAVKLVNNGTEQLKKLGNINLDYFNQPLESLTAEDQPARQRCSQGPQGSKSPNPWLYHGYKGLLKVRLSPICEGDYP